GVSRAVHDDPELCFEEHHASAVVAGALGAAGFQVEPGVFDLPTALRARAGSGPLSIVLCAEYDALPGVGHACGHNLIAASAVGAGIGLAAVADDIGLTVTVLGTPAEEGGGGKVMLLERGAFDGAHAAMMAHPWHEDRLGAVCLAVDHLEVRYLGREAHASAAPEKGVNAADAMVVAQVSIGLLRQHLPAGDQVHGIVTKGGDAANVVPKETLGRFMVRARTLEELAVLRARVERCFEAGALASGCELEIRTLSPTYSDYVADEPLLAAWRANAESLGRRFEADDRGDRVPTISTDMANVSRALPAIHPLIGLESGGAVIHEPAFAEVAVGPTSERALVDAALALAFTAIDAATVPELRQHLEARTAG
ncbi:MAG TPA: amidohydrolase, partial [Acidimicrobiales bacterium]|nr:amidohydrolase [Acidimicrobiales bacterium]